MALIIDATKYAVVVDALKKLGITTVDLTCQFLQTNVYKGETNRDGVLLSAQKEQLYNITVITL